MRYVTLSHTIFDFKMADDGNDKDNKRFKSEPGSTLSCHAVRLKPGQEIKDFLLNFVKVKKLGAPFVLSCVGSVTQATLRLANASIDTPNEIIEVKGRHEIVSLVGTLADEGHLHASLSDKDGNVIGGHVMGNMKVFTTAEVVIGNCDTLLFTRETDDETGFDELVVRGK